MIFLGGWGESVVAGSRGVQRNRQEGSRFRRRRNLAERRDGELNINEVDGGSREPSRSGFAEMGTEGVRRSGMEGRGKC